MGRRHAWALALLVGGCERDATPSPSAPPAQQAHGDDPSSCLARADALEPQERAVARAFCSEVRAHELTGASIALAIDGELRLRFATGDRCHGSPGPVVPETAFRIGSITKSITAALAHALAVRRAVELDRPLAAELGARLGAPPGFTPTLHELLDHTAGLPDILPSESLRSLTAPEQVRALLGTPTPGRGWSYANGGYALAGAWLADLGGAPWSELARREVLAPLAMVHAYPALGSAPLQGDAFACGHVREGDGRRAYTIDEDYARFAFGVDAAAPAGAIAASAEDLVRFALALSDHAPDDAPAWAQAMLVDLRSRAVPTGRAQGEYYADGVVVERLPGDITLLHHAGKTGDFAAELWWVPERGFAVAILSNGDEPLRATLAAALARGGVDPRRNH